MNRLLSAVVSFLGWREEVGVWQCQQVPGKKTPLVSIPNVTTFLFCLHLLEGSCSEQQFYCKVLQYHTGAVHCDLKDSLPTQGFSTGWGQCFHTAKVHTAASQLLYSVSPAGSAVSARQSGTFYFQKTCV